MSLFQELIEDAPFVVGETDYPSSLINTVKLIFILPLVFWRALEGGFQFFVDAEKSGVLDVMITILATLLAIVFVSLVFVFTGFYNGLRGRLRGIKIKK